MITTFLFGISLFEACNGKNYAIKLINSYDFIKIYTFKMSLRTSKILIILDVI